MTCLTDLWLMIKKMVGDNRWGDREWSNSSQKERMNAECGTWKQEGAIRWTYLEEAAAEREGEKGNRKEATGMGLVELYRLMACNDIYSCSICTCHITIWYLKPHTDGTLAAYEPLCMSPCAARLPTSFQDTFSIVTSLRETEAIDKVKKLILFF